MRNFQLVRHRLDQCCKMLATDPLMFLPAVVECGAGEKQCKIYAILIIKRNLPAHRAESLGRDVFFADALQLSKGTSIAGPSFASHDGSGKFFERRNSGLKSLL